jgi:hypothetical protein
LDALEGPASGAFFLCHKECDSTNKAADPTTRGVCYGSRKDETAGEIKADAVERLGGDGTEL